MASYFERALGQIRLDALRAGWLIFGEGFRQGWSRTFIKRVFDIVAASTLLLLALPVMLVTAILIVLEDGFPVFYKQERVGLNGRLFNVVKFRSMQGCQRWQAALGNGERRPDDEGLARSSASCVSTSCLSCIAYLLAT